VVILAGPAMNLLIAFVLFWAVLMSGSLNGVAVLERLNPSVPTTTSTTRIAAIERGMPADGVLRPGDRIIGVDGRRTSGEAARAQIAADRCAGALRNGCRGAAPVHLTVLRGSQTLTLTLYPRYDAQEKRMLIGFNLVARAKSFGPFAAAGAALGEMWHTTTGTFSGVGRALTEPKVRHEVSSIVGITADAHETVNEGAGRALVFLGFISLVLAVMNLLPFLPLDGGHLLWSVLEKLRGRRVSLMAMYRYSSVGILLLLFLVVNGVSNDISRLAG
jgi:regulator of sigma E protease